MTKTAKLWRFEALDTWFFREPRPADSAGGREFECIFPPPARTLAGAVRALLGERAGADWRSSEWMTNNRGALGRLELRGPYLALNGERLYPVPRLWLAQRGHDGSTMGGFSRLVLDGEPVETDLGRVYLPRLENPEVRDAKPIERVWVRREQFEMLLAGNLDGLLGTVAADELFGFESRVGIERSHSTHAAVEEMLYAFGHVRPRSGTGIEVEVGGLNDDEHPKNGTVRFGAEGRLAAMSRHECSPPVRLPQPPADAGKRRRLLIVFLTHADFGGSWLPAKTLLEGTDEKGARVWRGAIGVRVNSEPNSVKLTLCSAVIGKPVREGGWSLGAEINNKKKRENRTGSRALASLVPAGSCWFCETDDPDAARKLHGAQIGFGRELGRGEIAVGYW